MSECETVTGSSDERSARFSRYAPPATLVTLIVGLLLTLSTFLFVRDWEEKGLRHEFRHLVDLHLASFERELEVNLEVLRGVRDFLVAEPTANRHQFQVYTSGPLRRLGSIQALEWVPRVPAEYRDYYEEAARADGLEDFQFTELRQGKMLRAALRDDYYPVYFLAPLEQNKVALGFDLASNPARLAALIESRDSGRSYASAPIALLQETQNRPGFLLFLPIYDGVADDPRARRQRLRGFSVGVYRVDDIFEAALAKSQLKIGEIALRLFDRPNAQAPRLLYTHLSDPWPAESVIAQYQREVQVAGRTWLLVARPTSQFVAERRASAPYLAGALVLSLTLSLAAYFRFLRNRARAVRRLVQVRTEALAQSESRTRAILDTAVNAIITIDDKGSIQLFNPGAEQMFGYQRREVQGENVKMLMPEPFHGEHDDYLARYRRTHQPRIIGTEREVLGLRKDGSTFPIQLSVGESRFGDGSLFVGIIFDISEQKQAQQALLQAKEQAEASSRMKSEFVNMMSHELRTPLTVILGYIPVLKKAEQLPDAGMVVRIAEDIQSAGDHLLHLINDLLDLSKIEAGKLDLHFERLPLREVVEQAVSAFESKAAAKGIGLSGSADSGDVRADRVRLQQILINLIGNAVKFTDRGEVSVTGRHLGERIEISVRDTGCGIHEPDQRVIFDKFRQVDSSSTRAAGGTGLGLAITRRLVQLHGGGIVVTSAPGRGSTFSFTIPVEQEND